MVNDSDADRIQRDKDRRRAEERLRIEREHHRRLHDVETLRRTGSHIASSGEDRGPPNERKRQEPDPERLRQVAPMEEDVPSPSPVDIPPKRDDIPTSPRLPSRPIGKPVQSDPLRSFLAMDPAEQFDIQALNQLPFAPLLQEGREEGETLGLLAIRSEALMERVKREVDDPLTAGALLRGFALTWYQSSPGDDKWGEKMQDRWAGIFAESKVSGGKLHPWLNMRLWSVHQRAVREGGMGQRVRRGLSRSHVAESSVSRSPTQQIQAEVAQALTDDLAARPRKPESAFPLVRLSELSVRRQVATVNEALGTLFNSSEMGPFVVLHPNRYPDCEELQIRPPSGAATGAALAFSLVTPKGSRKTGGRSSGVEGHEGSGAEGSTSAGQGGEEDLDGVSIWEAKVASPTTWTSVLEASRRERQRLDAPPRDYRTRPAYATLREMLLRDGDVRRSFLAVKWRGRPAGLPILTTLLQKGTLAPEVSTDHEYLEAELGELGQGDPQYVPEGGTWHIPGWTVVREGTHAEGFRYRAQPETAHPA